MAIAYPIKLRCGFNLTLCEEVLLLEAYRHVREALAHDPLIRLFEDMVFTEGKGVEERAIITINQALKTAELPAVLRFYPKPTDWDDFMRTRGDERADKRTDILKRLEDGAGRGAVLEIARRDYARLPEPEREGADEGQRALFASGLQRIKDDQLHAPRWRGPSVAMPPPDTEQPDVADPPERTFPVLSLPAAVPLPLRPEGPPRRLARVGDAMAAAAVAVAEPEDDAPPGPSPVDPGLPAPVAAVAARAAELAALREERRGVEARLDALAEAVAEQSGRLEDVERREAEALEALEAAVAGL